MLVRQILIAALLLYTLNVSGSDSFAKGAQDKPEPDVTVPLKRGMIYSIVVPASWAKESHPASAGRLIKHRHQDNYWDCVVSIKVDNSFQLSSKQRNEFEEIIKSEQPTPEQIGKLSDIPGISGRTGDKDAQIQSTTYDINGKKLLYVERRGERWGGPLSPSTDGNWIQGTLSYARGSASVLTDTGLMQQIHFDTDVMGEIGPCVESIKKALKSIKWSR